MAEIVGYLSLPPRQQTTIILAMAPRRVVIVAFAGVQSLDVTGPLEVFDGANRWLISAARPDPAYRVVVATRGREPVSTSSGLGLIPHADLDGLRGPVDTLLVAGGEGSRRGVHDACLVEDIRTIARRARRVASACTGAFLLAEAGLLDGLRATTHWAWCSALARDYPQVAVEADPIFVRDGDVWTSAGVTAGIDLALAMVEEDLGHEAALAIARQLVLFLRRPANQSQFSAQLADQMAQRPGLREVQMWLADNLAGDLRVETLAGRAVMSPRNFARAWRHEICITPARYVERLRIEAARRRLEDTDEGLDQIAAECGFGVAETMRRSFLRTLGSPPSEYRRRFQSPALAAGA